MTISQENNKDAWWIAALWAAIHSSGPGPLEVHTDQQNIDTGAQFVANLKITGAASLTSAGLTQALQQAGISPVSGNDPSCPAGANLVSIISTEDDAVVAQFCVNDKLFGNP